MFNSAWEQGFLKSFLDALNGIIYADDSQVTDCRVIKGYADTPGVDILISTAG